MSSKAYDVYLNRKNIDTVFGSYGNIKTKKEREDHVRRSLIDHDGYDSEIKVRERKMRGFEGL